MSCASSRERDGDVLGFEVFVDALEAAFAALKVVTGATGPKISSVMIREPERTCLSTVGW